MLSLYFLKTPESGAQTQIFLALEKNEKLSNGGYYKDCSAREVRPVANSENVQDRLWTLSENLCKDFASL